MVADLPRRDGWRRQRRTGARGSVGATASPPVAAVFTAAVSIAVSGSLLLAAFAATAGAEVAFLGAGLEAIIGIEAAEGISLWVAEQSATVQEIINSVGGGAGL